MRRVKMLSYRNEGDVELIERLHNSREVEQRSAESIDLVDNDAIDLAALDANGLVHRSDSVEGSECLVAGEVVRIIRNLMLRHIPILGSTGMS